MLLHHPLVVHTDGTKLSKSQGDTGIAELRDAGWSAARVLGQAAWLGGLQHDPTPLSAEELPTLWSRRRQTP
jgi:glutamyl/glutaminyl-tRNA synthetase